MKAKIGKLLGRYKSSFDCLVAKAKNLPGPPQKGLGRESEKIKTN